jgi:GcrA cell cycle regulator
MPAKDTIWTEAKIEEIRALWGKGLTAREIADRLGEQFSRAAVIGKAFRLGLARHKPAYTSTDNGRKKPVPRPAPPPLPKLMPLPPERPGAPQMRRLQLVQLADNHCRWPVGDPHLPGFHFCAADTLGAVYCPYHMRVAFARTKAEA